MPQVGEVRRAVVGYEGLYEVSNRGRVFPVSPDVCRDVGRYKVTFGEPLRQHVADGSDHLAVYLRRPGLGSRRFYVHDLVLTAFTGPRPEGVEACHYPDRDPANNWVENLRWGTRQDNHDDMEEHGTAVLPPVLSGTANGMYGRKHTEETKAKMRGKVLSANHRRKLSDAWVGRRLKYGPKGRP